MVLFSNVSTSILCFSSSLLMFPYASTNQMVYSDQLLLLSASQLLGGWTGGSPVCLLASSHDARHVLPVQEVVARSQHHHSHLSTIMAHCDDDPNTTKTQNDRH